MADDFTEQKIKSGRLGGIKSAQTRRRRAEAKLNALKSVFKDEFELLSINQKNELCRRIFGKGLGNRFKESRGNDYLFNNRHDERHNINPTAEQIQECLKHYRPKRI
ncbi:hypothetical protein AA0312_0930 [Acetobacter tropicalis NRIC 0312]|uniref:Uncharacterized protein n=1 Tax=Acetobacter tropicalis TaxID=104102 RepID=A0A511FKY6_9PROT|nr:hypothetical protein [Acetobacter tropicalis]KXV47772.1 hypothetical protein AD944_11385 [Acetobacter tropicalis]GAL96925.1 hypothetical protein ATR1_056d0001 [Acetobacter tropicalis]GBR68473.1 hypothetical protein AA0312_0930 [Acetobacter tropicalis NRIC 0312]GEL49850.1 hypothetical protein ATR01nite_09250 [Acetobacter tropicalis]